MPSSLSREQEGITLPLSPRALATAGSSKAVSRALVLAAAAFFVPGLHAEEPSFSYFSHTGKDLFPSAIISTATVDWASFEEEEEAAAEEEAKEGAAEGEGEAPVPLLGDPDGWIGVSLSEVPEGASLTVELSGEGWLKPSKFTGKAVDENGDAVQGDIDVIPKAAWDFELLRKNLEQKPVNLTIKVSVNGKALPEQTETLILRSINDCPFFVIHGDPEDPEEIEDMSWCFAAYVNENHPWIDALLKEALTSAKDGDSSPLIDGFTGYQSGDTEEVLKQVFAIWQVLQRRGIKYSDVSSTTPSKTTVSQVVRSLDQTVEATQANCVDGSVLMASILTKIGLNAHLVMVPGHCFLAFDGDDKGESLIGLETTMLGADNLKSVEELQKLALKAEDKKLDAKKFKQLVAKEADASMTTFLNAIDVGNQSLEKHADAFEDASDPAIQIISISEARELGIMPLPSGKDRK